MVGITYIKKVVGSLICLFLFVPKGSTNSLITILVI